VNVRIVAAVLIAVLVALLHRVLSMAALGEVSDTAQQIYSNNVMSTGAVGNVRATATPARVDLATTPPPPASGNLGRGRVEFGARRLGWLC
jgi:methyl-accepting chemotaxis protein